MEVALNIRLASSLSRSRMISGVNPEALASRTSEICLKACALFLATRTNPFFSKPHAILSFAATNPISSTASNIADCNLLTLSKEERAAYLFAPPATDPLHHPPFRPEAPYPQKFFSITRTRVDGLCFKR